MARSAKVATEIPADLQRLLDKASYADIHPLVVDLVAKGGFTIVDLFETLPWFRNAADWTAWKAFLKAAYALPMDAQELAIYRECTGRKKPPEKPARQVWCPTGRRARKSAIAALIGVFESCFRDYSKYMAPNERATIPIIAKSMKEARQIMTFAKAILSDENLRNLLLEEPGAETVQLRTGVDLNIVAVSLTAGRSRTIPTGLLDEVAFFASEGAVPDEEVIRGMRPGMATIPDSKLFAFSSPYGKRGMLYRMHQQYYPLTRIEEDGPPQYTYHPEKEDAANRDRVLIWQAPTLRMHDTPQLRAEIANEYQLDPISAAAEYGAEFREDTDAFVLERLLDEAIVSGRKFLAWTKGRTYFAFIDPSGGSSDSLTLAVAHFEKDPEPPPPPQPYRLEDIPEDQETPPVLPGKVVLDLIREWPAPFDPEDVVEECASEMLRYGLRKAVGDKYGAKWPLSAFKRHKVSLGWSPTSKSEIYRDFLPLLNTKTVELLDNATMRSQFLILDRNVARGGRETIDHPTGAHDDVANAVAGACVLASSHGPRMARTEAKVANELPPATSTRELMQRRIAEQLQREKKPRGNRWSRWRR